MKEHGRMIASKVLEDSYIAMVTVTKESGLTTKLVEKVLIIQEIKWCIKDIGKMTNNKALEQKYIKMVPNSRDFIKMERNKAKAGFFG
jgi:hypothetical protein